MTDVIQPQHFRPDLHESKDLYHALDHLPVALRLRWLRLCCLKASFDSVLPIDVMEYDGRVESAIAAFYSICGQNDLTLEWATALATYLNRRQGKAEFAGIIQDIKAGRN